MINDMPLDSDTVIAHFAPDPQIIDWDLKEVTSSQATTFSNYLKKNSATLRAFSFSCAQISISSLLLILEGLEQARNLEKWVIPEIELESVLISTAIKLLKNNPKLNELRLSVVPTNATTALATAIFDLKKLSQLVLTGVDLTGGNLGKLDQLSILQLRRCQLGSFLDHLNDFPKILVLEISHISLSSAEVKLLSHYLQTHPVTTKLICVNVQLNDDKAKDIFQGVEKCSHLTTLDWSSNALNLSTVEKIQALKKDGSLPKLTEVNLRHNKFSITSSPYIQLQQSLVPKKLKQPVQSTSPK